MKEQKYIRFTGNLIGDNTFIQKLGWETSKILRIKNNKNIIGNKNYLVEILNDKKEVIQSLNPQVSSYCLIGNKQKRQRLYIRQQCSQIIYQVL